MSSHLWAETMRRSQVFRYSVGEECKVDNIPNGKLQPPLIK